MLQNIMQQYTNKNNIDLFNFRKFINEKYVEKWQQDVPEFIMDICLKSPVLKYTIEHKLILQTKCKIAIISMKNQMIIMWLY